MVDQQCERSAGTVAYLAAPLFSEAERTFNVIVASELEKLMSVYLPQRDGGLMSAMTLAGLPPKLAAAFVFERDMSAVRDADYLIAILDGRAIDEGVAFELGVAFSCGKRCVGLQTDSRRLASWGNNPMISGALEEVFMSVADLVSWMKGELAVVALNCSLPLSTEPTKQRPCSAPISLVCVVEDVEGNSVLNGAVGPR